MSKVNKDGDYSACLAAFASTLRFKDIPDAVLARLKTSVLDSIGCCLYGARLPWTKQVADLVSNEQAKPVATVLGSNIRTTVANAVLVNATAGHAFELDDIHTESVLHPGSIAVPIALAFAQQQGAWSGQDFLTSLAAGYELGIRVGNAATTALFFRGFHPQGTSGVFVAAATAGRALRLDPEAMLNALGIAGSQAGGLMAAQEGAMVKRFHAGRAAQSGVYAASLARTGFTGIRDVLEAEYGGFLSAYSGKANMSRLTEDLGSEWETEKVGYKPYAAVTSIHTALYGLLKLMRNHGLRAGDLEKIRVGVSPMTFTHCVWPYAAQGVTAAQMNLYYGLAVIAVDGDAFVDQYRLDRIGDPVISEMIKRIDAYVDPEIEKSGASSRHSCVVEVHTTDGRQWVERFTKRLGSFELPLTQDAIQEKFTKLVRDFMDREHIDRIVDTAFHLDERADVHELIDLLTDVST
ncbi:MAG: MmgE/PrpD family protein [Castellaniella sp.]